MDNLPDIERLLHRKGVDYKPHGREATAICPMCNSGGKRERTWSVNLDTGVFICNRQNHCGWKGSAWELFDYFGESPTAKRSNNLRIAPVPAKPKTYKQPDHSKVQGLTAEHLGWFDGRGIKPETVKAFRVSGKPGAIAFPVFGPDGKLVNIKWRSTSEKKFWNEEGAQKLPFGIHAVPPGAKALLLTEGEPDAMVAYQYGVDAVISLPNGASDLDWIDPLWEWLDRFDVLRLSLDMDRAGREGLRRLVNRLGAWRCRNVELPAPHKDLNDCLMAGVDAETIHRAIDGAGDFRPEKLRGIADLADDVFDLFHNKQGLLGKPTGFAGLNALLKGWRGGEVTVWTGQNGSGKSTILGQEMVNQAIAGETVCIGSFELDSRRYLRWLVCQYLNEPNPWDAAVSTALGALLDRMWFVDHVGSINPDELVPVYEYAARRYGAEHFVVDSLVKLKMRGEKLDAQIRAVESLCDFADNFNAHVHLVAHPRKGESDDDMPDKTRIKGAGEITDLADNVISVHRNKNPKDGQAGTILAVLKNREHGLEGRAPVYVNPDTKRVTDATETYASDPSPPRRSPEKRFTPPKAKDIVRSFTEPASDPPTLPFTPPEPRPFVGTEVQDYSDSE